MSLFFKTRLGQTPVDPSIIKELIPKHVQDMNELYELESENIALGIIWLQQTKGDHLDYLLWIESHKHLLKEIWKFAGKTRKIELANTDFHASFNVRPALRDLEADLKTWIEFETYPPKEMIAIFHQRLLTIHPFRDGNGRWSRVITEFICQRQEIDVPTWGSKTIPDDEARRTAYIEAVTLARHKQNYDKLIKLMWS